MQRYLFTFFEQLTGDVQRKLTIQVKNHGRNLFKVQLTIKDLMFFENRLHQNYFFVNLQIFRNSFSVEHAWPFFRYQWYTWAERYLFWRFLHLWRLFRSSTMSDAGNTAHQRVGGYNRQPLRQIKLIQVGKIWSYFLDLIFYFSYAKLIFNCTLLSCHVRVSEWIHTL